MSNASAAGGAGVGAGAGAGSGAGAEAGARKRPRLLAADGSSSSDEAGAQLSAQMQRMSAELAHTQRLLAAYMSRDDSLISTSQLSASQPSDGSSPPAPSPQAEIQALKEKVASLQRTPRVGVGVFVCSPDHPGCVLMGERKGSLGSGMHALPGGHLEFGETMEECGARELLEETGLIATSAGFVTANNCVWQREGKHYVTGFVTVTVKPGSVPQRMEPHKCLGWNWVKFEDIGRGEQAGRVFKPLHALVEGGPGSGRRSGQSVADLITGAELHALHSA